MAKVFISAGEASGDMHGARLLGALQKLSPGITAAGVGGQALAGAGMEILCPSEELTMMGFSELPQKLPAIWRALKMLKAHLRQARPDLVILIDFPDFNFRLGKAAKKLGLKVLYYISPQMWAWRPGRAQAMAGFVDHLAVVFPFEPEFLAKTAPELNTTFVGHPLLDQPEDETQPPPLPVPEGSEVVGLLPGSRKSEIDHILPLLFESARLLRHKRPLTHFVLPLAPGLSQEVLEPHLPLAPPGLTILPGGAARVMRHARLLLIASGTATLQAALAGAPMVVLYKTGALNFWLAKRLVQVDFIAMPNLIAGKAVLPELIQGQAKPQAVAAAALELLDHGPARSEMLAGLKDVKQRMGGPGASGRTAQLAMSIMQRDNQ